MPFLDSKPPALLGELVTNSAFTSLSEQELGFPEAEKRWFRAVMMTLQCGWRPGEDLAAIKLPHTGPPCPIQVPFDLDGLPFAEG